MKEEKTVEYIDLRTKFSIKPKLKWNGKDVPLLEITDSIIQFVLDSITLDSNHKEDMSNLNEIIQPLCAHMMVPILEILVSKDVISEYEMEFYLDSPLRRNTLVWLMLSGYMLRTLEETDMLSIEMEKTPITDEQIQKRRENEEVKFLRKVLTEADMSGSELIEAIDKTNTPLDEKTRNFLTKLLKG